MNRLEKWVLTKMMFCTQPYLIDVSAACVRGDLVLDLLVQC